MTKDFSARFMDGRQNTWQGANYKVYKLECQPFLCRIYREKASGKGDHDLQLVECTEYCRAAVLRGAK